MGGCRIIYSSGEHMITVGGYRVHSGGSTSSGTNGNTRVADATVNDYRSAVGGLGHIGISVNKDPSKGYYPRDEGPVTKAEQGLGMDVPGAVKKDDASELGKPTSHTIHTTSAQDKAMRAYINQRQKKPGNYDLYDRNCKDFVRSVLGAGGIKTKDDTIPNNWYNDNYGPKQ